MTDPASAALRSVLPRIQAIASRISKADRDDLISVGLLGAWRAWEAGEREDRLLAGKAAWYMRDFMRTAASTRSQRRLFVSLDTWPAPMDEVSQFASPVPDPERELLTAERQIQLDRAIDSLPRRTARVVRGVLSGEPKNEISKVVGVNPSRVSQIIKAVVGELAEAIKAA